MKLIITEQSKLLFLFLSQETISHWYSYVTNGTSSPSSLKIKLFFKIPITSWDGGNRGTEWY